MPNDPEDFNKFNSANTPDGKDDFVDSSFAVQFKPGDKTESIADKLKETKENIEKQSSGITQPSSSRFDFNSDNAFKDKLADEFDSFEFDSSISAFKPFKAPEQTSSSTAATIPAIKPAPASNDPVFPKNGGTFDKPAFTPKAPEPAKEALPKFNDAEKAQVKPSDDKLFKSGSGLDFATSEHDKKTSPFMNTEKPDLPKPANIDIPTAEKIQTPAKTEPAKPTSPFASAPAKPVNPFASEPEKQKPVTPDDSKTQAQGGYRPYPSAAKTNLFTSPAQATKEAEKAFAEFLDDDFKPSSNVPISPFKSINTTRPAASTAPAAPAKPAAPATPAAPAAPAVSAAPVKPATPAAPAAPAAPVAPAKPAEPVKSIIPDIPAKPVEPAKPAEPVNPASNVIPVKRPEAVKPAEPAKSIIPETPAKPAEPAKAATATVAATGAVVAATTAAAAVKPTETVKAPAETERPHRPAATATPAAPAKPVAPAATAPVKPAAPAAAAAPATAATKPATPAAPVKPAATSSEAAQRPGTSSNKPAPVPVNPASSPFEAKGKQPVAATRGVAQNQGHDNKAISPVTTVKKSKKKKDPKSQKDPGLAGLITFLVIIFLAIGILWALDNTAGIKSFFGKKTVETIATKTSATSIESSKEETETTETTTEATTTTTEATTTTTEATTTTTEATTTTTEATTTTTEATTTTTEATTKSTEETKKTAGGEKVTDIGTKITNFKQTKKGFKFTIELKNKSNKTCNLPKSLNYLDIELFAGAGIKSVSSDAMTFKLKKDGKTYRGTPKEIAIKAGETYSFTVNVTTKESVVKYGYNKAYFDWKK